MKIYETPNEHILLTYDGFVYRLAPANFIFNLFKGNKELIYEGLKHNGSINTEYKKHSFCNLNKHFFMFTIEELQTVLNDVEFNKFIKYYVKG